MKIRIQRFTSAAEPNSQQTNRNKNMTFLADVSLHIHISSNEIIITFRVSRRPREMYCGHARLCVCLCVCPRPHAHTIERTRM